MKCDKCGFENLENAEYCQECGTKIKPEENKTRISNLIIGKRL